MIKVKDSRNRPGVAQRDPGGLGSQISATFGTWIWWGCLPNAPAVFNPRKYSSYSFSLGAEPTPGPWNSRKGICPWKIQWHHRESIQEPTSSAAPYVLRHTRPLSQEEQVFFSLFQFSRTPLIQINLDDQPSWYAENPDKWLFLWKQAILAVWSGRKIFNKRLL